MFRYWYTDGDYETQGDDKPLNVLYNEPSTLDLEYAGSELIAVF